jgi:hypothetical protein
MLMNDAAHIGQSNPGAGKLRRRVQALKNSKKFFDVTHIKSNPVVLDENDVFFIPGPAADLDADMIARPGVFESVAN